MGVWCNISFGVGVRNSESTETMQDQATQNLYHSDSTRLNQIKPDLTTRLIQTYLGFQTSFKHPTPNLQSQALRKQKRSKSLSYGQLEKSRQGPQRCHPNFGRIRERKHTQKYEKSIQSICNERTEIRLLRQILRT